MISTTVKGISRLFKWNKNKYGDVMKKTVVTIGTEHGTYLRHRRPLPGLFWSELIQLLEDWHKFERGRKGTRFDPWLKKSP